MKALSKSVVASSLIKTEDLLKIAQRYSTESYKRPIENEAALKEKISKFCQKRNLILDAGCGVGESSFHLANSHPDCAVLGVDKSLSRVERKNHFKRDMPENLLLMQADMQDIWPLLVKMKNAGEIRLEKQYILYPNPWPKLKGVKRRWYANPMIAFILELGGQIEARSNWPVYLEDFQKVFHHLTQGESSFGEFIPSEYISPFERKYHQSGQKLYRLELVQHES